MAALPLPEALARAGVALRAETAGDRAFLVDLYAGQRAAEVATMPWSAIEQVRFVADQFRLQEAHWATHRAGADRWIVERAGAAIGRLYLMRPPAGAWELIEIGLIAGERGGGVGSALIDAVLAGAAAAGRDVVLQVAPDNAGAIALYRRKGFRGDGPEAAGRLPMRRPSGRAPAVARRRGVTGATGRCR